MDSDHSDVRNALVDPKLLFAATSLVIAASLGTCRLTALRLGRRTQSNSQSQDSLINASHQSKSQANLHSDSGSVADKKKRQKDRRKRTPAPKLPKFAPYSPNFDSPQFSPVQRQVIRQPSALGGTRRQRFQEESISELGESITGHDNHPETSKVVAPEDIPLPPSPRSASGSSSPTTSTTPLTPPSIAASQLPLPPLVPESSSSWHWAQTNDSTNLKPLNHKGPLLPPQQQSRGRKRRAKSPGAPLLIPKPIEISLPTPVDISITPFPTLNTLPPPNTPLDAQVEFMRQQVESSRAHENAARAREDELLGEVQRAREEMDRARKDVEGLRWQLGEMNQREERLIGQLNALTMQLQSMGMGIPVPLYSPQQQQQSSSQPIPMSLQYHTPPPHHLAYYHPHPHPHSFVRASPADIPVPIPSGSIPVPMPMPMPPTPTSLVSPTFAHPLLSVPQSTGSGGSAASESEEVDAEGPMISYGLVEAIFKRPESYASVSRSRGRDSRASARGFESHASDATSESRVSGKASTGSMGTRSPTESSSVSGQEFTESEHAYGGVSSGSAGTSERSRGRDPTPVILESTPDSMLSAEVLYDTRESKPNSLEQGSDADEKDDDGVPTPGQEPPLHGMTEDHRHASVHHSSADGIGDDHFVYEGAPGVPVFY